MNEEKEIASLADYVAALKRHDWLAEFSEDIRDFRKGTRERAALLKAQPHYDPAYVIWNQHAHPYYQMPREPFQNLLKAFEKPADGEHKTSRQHRSSS